MANIYVCKIGTDCIKTFVSMTTNVSMNVYDKICNGILLCWIFFSFAYSLKSWTQSIFGDFRILATELTALEHQNI